MAVKIAVANQKGGAGKTTTSICLSQELKERGYRVLFVDTDAQCNSTFFFGGVTENQATMIDILCGDYTAKDCIQKTKYVDLIASDKQLSDAENMVKLNERRFTHFKRSIRSIENDYDFVIIDTPPVIGVVLKNVLAAVDYILMPMDESGWSLQGAMDFYEAVDLARDNNEKLKIVGIVITQSNPRTNKAKNLLEIAKVLADKMGTRVFRSRIRNSVACSQALTVSNIPLHLFAPKNTTLEDYRNLTDEILESIQEDRI